MPGKPFQRGADPRRGHGKKGRSGRKPLDFVAWCESVTSDEQVRTTHLAFARAGSVKHTDMCAKYAHGVPKQQVEHTGELTVKVVRG